MGLQMAKSHRLTEHWWGRSGLWGAVTWVGASAGAVDLRFGRGRRKALWVSLGGGDGVLTLRRWPHKSENMLNTSESHT